MLSKSIEINISITQNLGDGKNIMNWGVFNTEIRKVIFYLQKYNFKFYFFCQRQNFFFF
jgi:hypothetical protein